MAQVVQIARWSRWIWNPGGPGGGYVQVARWSRWAGNLGGPGGQVVLMGWKSSGPGGQVVQVGWKSRWSRWPGGLEIVIDESHTPPIHMDPPVQVARWSRWTCHKNE